MLFSALGFFMIGFLTSCYAQSQEYLTQYKARIIPPSPTAHEISTYGNLPLNGSSGAFSYNLPIYTITSGDITLPISLNYHSGGVNVDKLAGSVGMDWVLNAGGAVSRIVKDFPDELAVRWYPSTIDPVEQEVMVRNIARDSGFDGEQDWFSFNVNGLSGSFYFDENLVPHILGNDNLKITFEQLNGTSGLLNKFILKDDRGFTYIFGGAPGFIEGNLDLEECSLPNPNTVTAWFLKEIISPSNASVTFEYISNNFNYKVSHSFNIDIQQICSEPGEPQILEGLLPYTPTSCTNVNYLDSNVISAINFNTVKNNGVVISNQSVNFEYNDNRIDGGGKSLKNIKVKNNSELVQQIDLLYDVVTARNVPINSALLSDNTLKYRLFLKDVIFKGNSSSTNWLKHSFEYYEPDELPIRLSYSKDKFGFNNESYNTWPFSSIQSDYSNFNYIQIAQTSGYLTGNREVKPNVVHYGMMKKITHPTKGQTEINYEPHKDIIVETIPVTTNYQINTYKPNCTGENITQEYTFISNGSPINFEASAMYIGVPCNSNGVYSIKIYKENQSTPFYAMYNIAFNTNSYTIKRTTDPAKSCLNTFTNYVFNEDPICTNAGSTYKITLTLENAAGAGYIKLFYNALDTTVETPKYSGGARVSKITDITDDKPYNTRKFYYNKLANIASQNTTLQNRFEPLFDMLRQPIIWCKFVNCDETVRDHLCCLRYEPRFSVNYLLQTDAYNASYLTRLGPSYLAITEVFDSGEVKNGSIERLYNASVASPAQMIMGYDIYGSSPSNEGEIMKDKIIEETVYDVNSNMKNKKTYQYIRLSPGYLTSVFARRKEKLPQDPDWNNPKVCSLIQFAPMSNFSILTYKNNYAIVKLNQQVEIDYLDGQEVKRETTYKYNNPDHLQLSSVTTTSSLDENGSQTQTSLIDENYNIPSDVNECNAPSVNNWLKNSAAICLVNEGGRMKITTSTIVGAYKYLPLLAEQRYKITMDIDKGTASQVKYRIYDRNNDTASFTSEFIANSGTCTIYFTPPAYTGTAPVYHIQVYNGLYNSTPVIFYLDNFKLVKLSDEAESLETKYFYPGDAEVATEPVVNDLIAKNILTLLKTQTFRSGNKLSEQKTVYKNWGTASGPLYLPELIQASKGIAAPETRVRYLEVDTSNGNVLRLKQEDGMEQTYIWGYNGTYPIAKIENSTGTFASVASALGTTPEALKVMTSAPANIREVFPNAMVTTYTYEPLVGVTSITDPRGYKTTYEYDASARLKAVYDNDNNLLSENKYHYRP